MFAMVVFTKFVNGGRNVNGGCNATVKCLRTMMSLLG